MSAVPHHNENDPIVDPLDPTDPVNHALAEDAVVVAPASAPASESVMDKIADMAAAARDSAAQALESVNETAHRWFDKGKDDVATAYDTTAEKASEAADIAKEKAEDAWDASRRTAEDMKDKASSLFSSSSSSSDIDSKSFSSSSSSSSSSEPYPSSMISDSDRAALHRENAQLHARAAEYDAGVAKDKGKEAASEFMHAGGDSLKNRAEASYEDAKHTPAGAYENTAVRDKVEYAKDVAADTWDRTKHDVSAAAEATKDKAAGAWEATKDYVSDKAQAVKETAESGWEKTKEVASDMTDAAKDKASDASNAASRSFERAKDSASDKMADMERSADRMGARIADKEPGAALQKGSSWQDSKLNQLAGAATKEDAEHLGLVDSSGAQRTSSPRHIESSGAQAYRPPLVEPISPRDVDKTTDTYLLSKSHPATDTYPSKTDADVPFRSEHSPGFIDAAKESLAHIGSSLSHAGQALKETVIGSKPHGSE